MVEALVAILVQEVVWILVALLVPKVVVLVGDNS